MGMNFTANNCFNNDKKEVMMNSIKDKIIMITGASSGFGKITAEKCVSLGVKVVLGARREKLRIV